MNRADCKALRSAALLLNEWAGHITMKTPPADRWKEKHLRLVKRLRAVANAEQKRIEQERTAREFQAAYDEGDIE